MVPVALRVDKFKSSLTQENVSEVLSTYILDCLPYIFDENNEYIRWKKQLANMLSIDPLAVKIIGSSCLGFSPHKCYKKMSEESDIDVAIVSQLYFDIAWHTLRNIGIDYHACSTEEKKSIKHHQDRLIYYGTIATDKILGVLPFASEWNNASSEMSKVEPTKNKQINFRIYKDFDSLTAYQLKSLKKVKDNLHSSPKITEIKEVS